MQTRSAIISVYFISFSFLFFFSKKLILKMHLCYLLNHNLQAITILTEKVISAVTFIIYFLFSYIFKTIGDHGWYH